MIQNTVRWRSDKLDGTVVARCLGTPGQTKVSGDRQRETTHEICCLAAKYYKQEAFQTIMFSTDGPCLFYNLNLLWRDDI